MTSGQVADHMRRVGLNPDECDLLEVTGKGEEPETIPTRLAVHRRGYVYCGPGLERVVVDPRRSDHSVLVIRCDTTRTGVQK
jgi:hypothetical protein